MAQQLLHNRYDKATLRQQLAAEDFPRKTVSFYRYVRLEEPEQLRDTLYQQWQALGCRGRIYIAREGINAQMSVPEPHWEAFLQQLYSDPRFAGVPMKHAVEEDSESFLKLTIKVKRQIVADGLSEADYDPSDVGTHLSPEEFNAAIAAGATVVDMRNNYECEVGHFDGAYCPESDTFREAITEVQAHLSAMGKTEQDPIILYCTGGIRCEKASAYFRSRGHKNVGQLHGGIIAYGHGVEQNGLDCRYRGVNFVFDERVGERISAEVISQCHQCGQPSDRHVNCANPACHLLFLQCTGCEVSKGPVCSPACQAFYTAYQQQPPAEQKRARQQWAAEHKTHEGNCCLNVHNRRIGTRNLQQLWEQ